MNTRFFCVVVAAGLAVVLTACSDDSTPADSGPDGPGGGDLTITDGPGTDGPPTDQKTGDGPATDAIPGDQSLSDGSNPGGPPIQFGGTGSNGIVAMGRDAAGNTVIVGSYGDAVTFGTTTLTPTNTSPHMFIAKLDPAGTFVWAKGYSTKSSIYGISPADLAVDAAGNSYITFAVDGTAQVGSKTLPTGSYAAKLSPAGAVLWTAASSFYGPEAAVGAIAVDGAGNSYFATQVYHAPPPAKTPEHVVVVKLSPSGAVLSNAAVIGVSGSHGSRGKAIAVDSAGKVYLAGTFRKKVKFGNTVLDAPLSDQIFVARADTTTTTGTFTWAVSAGIPDSGSDNRPTGIGVDAAGNIYVTGILRPKSGQTGTAKFGTHTASIPTVGVGGHTIFVTKLGASGSFAWLKTSKPAGKFGDQALGIAVDSAGNSFIVGNSEQSTFGTVPLAAGGLRPFAAKLNPSGAFQWIAAPTVQGSAVVRGCCIALSGPGTSVIAGTLKPAPSGGGSATFGSSTLTPPPTFFMAKVGSNGKL